MERLLEIKIKYKKPYIILKRELTTTDFQVVSGNEAKPNSMRFMFDEEDSWQRLEQIKSKPEMDSVLKLRFLYATELEDCLRDQISDMKTNLSQKHWVSISEMRRVYKRMVHGLTEEELETEQELHEQPLYEAAVKSVNKAINDFNMISMTD